MDAGMIAARQHSQMNRWRLTCNPTTPRNERGCTQKMQPLDLNGAAGTKKPAQTRMNTMFACGNIKIVPPFVPPHGNAYPPARLQTQGGAVCERGANHQPEHHTTPLEDVAQQSESAAE